MTPERWIVIPNWDGPDGFQHYKDRTPRWIKNYAELLHDSSYLSLTLHQRGVLHGLWLEYATARRQVPDSTSTISRRLGERVTRATLDSLYHAGWIEYSASKPLAQCYQRASLEKRRGEEEHPPHPPQRGRTNGNRRRSRTNEQPAQPISLQDMWANWCDERRRTSKFLPAANTTDDYALMELNHMRTLPHVHGDIPDSEALEQWHAAHAPITVPPHDDDIPF